MKNSLSPLEAKLLRALKTIYEDVRMGHPRNTVYRAIKAAESKIKKYGKVWETPPTEDDLRKIQDKDQWVEVTIAVGLSDIGECANYEAFLDLIIAAAGSEMLMDISHKVVGHDGDTLYIQVTADASQAIEPGVVGKFKIQQSCANGWADVKVTNNNGETYHVEYFKTRKAANTELADLARGEKGSFRVVPGDTEAQDDIY